MAGRKGQECPHCGKLTFHNDRGIHQCSRCGAVGWSWQHQPADVGKGSGKRCPNCKNHTLHWVAELESHNNVRRCRTCNYTLIEPPPS